MNLLSDLSSQLVPIIALLIPIVWIVSAAILKITKINLLHETVRILSASGQPIPAELINKLIDKNPA
jgi:hypothetical protein